LNKKHLGWRALKGTAKIAAGHLLRGQTNFVKMLWKFNSVYNPELQLADHRRPAVYEMSPPPPARHTIDAKELFILPAKGRKGRAIDDDTEKFVDITRTSTAA
jgi:hopanoid C-3 methylase